MAISKRMKQLRAQAERKAARKGHRLGPWQKADARGSNLECSARCTKFDCAALVRIEDWKPLVQAGRVTRPPIFGSAVGVRCSGKIARLRKAPTPWPPMPRTLRVGLDALRRALRTLESPEQGGYVSYQGKGRWGFASTSLGQIEPDDLNALFALAGISPKPVVTLGACADCRYSDRGEERGYATPCNSCLRPLHSNFEPKPKKLKVVG